MWGKNYPCFKILMSNMEDDSMAKKFISGVYFIKNEETGLIKIGCSKDINKRYRDLQAQNEHLGYTNKLVLLDKILVDNYYDLEQYIHNKYSEKRVINEWFKITKEDILSIKKELGDSSYRGFDSGYIKTDRNAANEFIELGLSYSDIGLIFVLKDFIDKNNVLTLEDKSLKQKDLMDVTGLKRTSLYDKMNLFHEKNIIKSIKSEKDSKSNMYIVNPKYFRLSNYNEDNPHKDLFL